MSVIAHQVPGPKIDFPDDFDWDAVDQAIARLDAYESDAPDSDPLPPPPSAEEAVGAVSDSDLRRAVTNAYRRVADPMRWNFAPGHGRQEARALIREIKDDAAQKAVVRLLGLLGFSSDANGGQRVAFDDANGEHWEFDGSDGRLYPQDRGDRRTLTLTFPDPPVARGGSPLKLSDVQEALVPEPYWELEAPLSAASYRRKHPECESCGAPSKEVDHILPKRLFDPDGPLGHLWAVDWNFRALCLRCHRAKTSADGQEFGAHGPATTAHLDAIRRVSESPEDAAKSRRNIQWHASKEAA